MAGSEIYRVEIPIIVDDQTGPAFQQAQRKVSQFERSAQKTNENIRRMFGRDIQLRISAVDRVWPVVQRVQSSLWGITSRVWSVTLQAKDKITGTIKNIISKLTSPLALLGAGAGVGAGVLFPLQLAGEMEQAGIAMEYFTGSAEKGQKYLERLQAFAAKTPFEFPDVRQAAIGLMPIYKNMYGVNKAMNESIRTIQAFGDAAGFTGAGINGMNLALLGFRQIGAIGKLSMEELRQVTENLLIPMDMVTKELGITGDQLQDLGRLGIPAGKAMEAIVRALEKNFAGGMEKMSKSLLGLTSTIKDTARLTVTAFGAGMADPVRRILLDITGLTDYTGDKYKAFAKKLEGAGRAVGETFERVYNSTKQFFDGLSQDEAFQKMDWGDKIVYVFDQMIEAMSSWVSGPGGKQVEKVFVKLAEIGTRAWLTALGGMVKGAGESLLQGNIIGSTGLLAGAGLLGGGMLLRGAWGAGKGVAGLGRRVFGRGAGAGVAGAATETAATAAKGFNLGHLLREWFVTPASKRALEPIKRAVIPGAPEQIYRHLGFLPGAPEVGALREAGTAAKTVGGGWAPLRYIGKFGKVGDFLSRWAIPLTLATGAAEVAFARPEERVQTGLQVGGRIGGGLAGATLGAKAGATAGTLIAPGIGTVIGGAVGGLGGGIAGAFGGEVIVKRISDLTKRVDFSVLKEKAAEAFSGLNNRVTQSLDKLKENVSERFMAVRDTVVGHIQEAVEGASAWFSHLPENFGFIIGFIVGKLVQLPEWIADLPKQIGDYFSQVHTVAVQWVKQTVDDIITWFSGLPGQISVWWRQMVNSVAILGQQLWASTVAWASQTVDGITAWWSGLPEQVSNWWAGVWRAVENWASNTYSSVVNWFSGIPNMIEGWVSSAVDRITGLASSAWERIKSLGGQISGGYSAGKAAAQPHASGGILTHPHLGLVAEAGPEAIIPLSTRMRGRAIALYEEAGRRLGVRPYAEGGFAGPIPTAVPAVAGLGGFAPPSATINLNFDLGGLVRQVIIENRDDIDDAVDKITGAIANNLRGVFQNMTKPPN